MWSHDYRLSDLLYASSRPIQGFPGVLISAILGKPTNHGDRVLASYSVHITIAIIITSRVFNGVRRAMSPRSIDVAYPLSRCREGLNSELYRVPRVLPDVPRVQILSPTTNPDPQFEIQSDLTTPGSLNSCSRLPSIILSISLFHEEFPICFIGSTGKRWISIMDAIAFNIESCLLRSAYKFTPVRNKQMFKQVLKWKLSFKIRVLI